MGVKYPSKLGHLNLHEYTISLISGFGLVPFTVINAFPILLLLFVVIQRIAFPNKDASITEERWVGIEDVTAHLQVAKESIYRWTQAKGFPTHRVGRLFRFKLSEVDEWVKRGNKKNQKTSKKVG